MAAFLFFALISCVAATDIEHVLLFVVDGLVPSDVEQIKAYPNLLPNFNYFIRQGIEYPRHQVTNPSDPFPALSSILTGN